MPVTTWTYFSAFDNTGAVIPDSEWQFESGVTDANVVEIYERVGDTFRIICPTSAAPATPESTWRCST